MDDSANHREDCDCHEGEGDVCGALYLKLYQDFPVMRLMICKIRRGRAFSECIGFNGSREQHGE